MGHEYNVFYTCTQEYVQLNSRNLSNCAAFAQTETVNAKLRVQGWHKRRQVAQQKRLWRWQKFTDVSKVLAASIIITPWRYRSYVSPKCWRLPMSVHSAKTQKNNNIISLTYWNTASCNVKVDVHKCKRIAVKIVNTKDFSLCRC
jgi:hypothetical protein